MDANSDRVKELETQIKDCLFWFNRDGSPCDGHRFREEFDKLRKLVGYDASKVHDYSYRIKNHLCDEKGRCNCPSWKNGSARMVPAYKLAIFDSFKKESRCKTCEKTAERWRSTVPKPVANPQPQHVQDQRDH